MNWRNEWQAIAGHIRGFAASANSFLKSGGGSDTFSVARKQLLPHAKRIYDILKKFKEDYETILPSHACECLSVLIREREELFSKTEPMVAGSAREDVQARLCILESIQAELTYHLSDFSAIAKRLSERGFLHLQRSIIADTSVKQRWCDAFNTKHGAEVACEKLGGVHLLLHGIWAFKVHTPEERTDLVLQEPIRDFAEVEQAAEALVLTEWKTVKRVSEQRKNAEAARRQASIYASSVLGGIELRQYRYLVLVSEDRLPETPDIREGGIVYRHINIAVDPKSPSQASRTKKRGSV
jgi:hypothetical protein